MAVSEYAQPWRGAGGTAQQGRPPILLGLTAGRRTGTLLAGTVFLGRVSKSKLLGHGVPRSRLDAGHDSVGDFLVGANESLEVESQPELHCARRVALRERSPERGRAPVPIRLAEHDAVEDVSQLRLEPNLELRGDPSVLEEC